MLFKNLIMKQLFLLLLASVSISLVNAQNDSSSLKEFTGRYVFPEGNIVPEVSVILQGEDLSMSSTVGTSVLQKLGVDSFSIVEFSGSAVFKRNDDKKINGVHIEAAGYVMDGTKDESTGWSLRVYRKPSDVFILTKN